MSNNNEIISINNNNDFFNRIKTSTIIKIAVINVFPVKREVLKKKIQKYITIISPKRNFI